MNEEKIRKLSDFLEERMHFTPGCDCAACGGVKLWRDVLATYYADLRQQQEAMIETTKRLQSAESKLSYFHQINKKHERRYESIIRRVCRAVGVKPDLRRYDLGKQLVDVIKGRTS